MNSLLLEFMLIMIESSGIYKGKRYDENTIFEFTIQNDAMSDMIRVMNDEYSLEWFEPHHGPGFQRDDLFSASAVKYNIKLAKGLSLEINVELRPILRRPSR